MKNYPQTIVTNYSEMLPHLATSNMKDPSPLTHPPRDQMYEYCQDKLMSRVTQEFRNETFDTSFFKDLGELGVLGPTIQG